MRGPLLLLCNVRGIVGKLCAQAWRRGGEHTSIVSSKWLAHRHDCTILSQRIMRKFAADEEYWLKNPDKGALRT